MTHGETYTFENGPNCKGRGASFGEGETGYTVDIVQLRESYPDQGKWSFNNVTAFDVFMLKGAATLALRHGADNIERVELDGSTNSDTAKTYPIPAKTHYRWENTGRDTDDGWTELTLVGHPGFTNDQYQVLSEEELRDMEDLLSATDPVELESQRSGHNG